MAVDIQHLNNNKLVLTDIFHGLIGINVILNSHVPSTNSSDIFVVPNENKMVAWTVLLCTLLLRKNNTFSLYNANRFMFYVRNNFIIIFKCNRFHLEKNKFTEAEEEKP